MLNLNRVGRPVARTDKRKYSGMIVSIKDQCRNDDKGDNDNIIKESERLHISNVSKLQQVANRTRGERERDFFFYRILFKS